MNRQYPTDKQNNSEKQPFEGYTQAFLALLGSGYSFAEVRAIEETAQFIPAFTMTFDDGRREFFDFRRQA